MQNEKMNENKNPRKILYILLSVLIAVGFWIYVDEYGNNGTPRIVERKIMDIPIEYIGEELLVERGLMLLESGTSETVDLTLEGARRLVTALDRSNVRVVANLSEVSTAGMQTVSYSIAYSDGKFSGGSVKEVERSISRATVNISELSKKTLDIHCDLVGNVADGYSAGQVQLSQDTVEIRGQTADIVPASYAKVVLNIGTDAVKSVKEMLTLQFYDENDRLLNSNGIFAAETRVMATLPVYVTKEVKLGMGFKEHPGARTENLDFALSPSSIMVSGEADKLWNVDTIVVGEFDLLDLLGNDSVTHAYSILIPDGCQNLSGVTRATLEVKFKDMKIARVPTSTFQYENMPINKKVTVLSEDLTVRIFGKAADVDAVTGENISVIANLSDYSGASGTYTVPVAIDVVADGDIGVSGTYEIKINIAEEAEEENPSQAQQE